jgi:hypothetical protein
LSIDYAKKNAILLLDGISRFNNGLINPSSSLITKAILFGMAFIFLCNTVGLGSTEENGDDVRWSCRCYAHDVIPEAG